MIRTHLPNIARSVLTLLLGAAAFVSAAPSKFDPTLLDPRYPDMAEWAKAGVSGGIPNNLLSTTQVARGSDLQVLIDSAAEQFTAASADAPIRVLQLAAGEYILTTSLRLRSNVVLRGAPDGVTKLHLKLRAVNPTAPVAADGFSNLTAGIIARDVHHAGLEDLIITYDESLPSPPTLRKDLTAFANNPQGRTDLWVAGVRFTRARDSWVSRCQIVNFGTHPVMIEASTHLTIAKTEITGAHNKGEGAGDFDINRSSYTLLDEIHVRDLRHFVFQNSDPTFPCRYNVVIRSHLEVDVNFLQGDGGHNLIENCIIAIPAWHWWPPIGTGIAGQNQPPGPGNLFYRCSATRAFTATERNFSIADDPERVYVVRDRFEKNQSIVRPVGDAPRANTLYPVR